MIDVLDSHTAMRAILTAPLADRPDLLREMLEPVAGMYRNFPGEVDLVAMHHMGSGFRVDRDDDRALPALDALRDADVWERVRTALHAALDHQLAATPGIAVPDIQVMIVLGDSRDEHFMDVALGMVANGATDDMWLNFWPSPENLARVEATAVHEFHHQLRYATVDWNPATVTVGEQVVSEGLADAFARELYGDDLGYARIGVAAQHDEAAYAKVVDGLGVTGMQNFSAYVHGDAIAARFGATPVGLPTGAGYAVGNRLVDAYLAETGRTAAQALHVDAAEVIRLATQVSRWLVRQGSGS